MFTHMGNAIFLFAAHEWLNENNPFDAWNRKQRRHPEGDLSSDFGHAKGTVHKHNIKSFKRTF